MVATLPLYATFLDEPFDPSPYSPVSRLHWNEVYLDDDGLPAGPDAADSATSSTGAALGRCAGVASWSRPPVARRRRLQDELTAFAAAHPDVGAYARFRAGRDAGGDLVVERSHLLAQYLADQQLAAIRDDPDAAALALDLPIGSHPAGYEVWADPSMFAAADERRRPARHVLRRRPELGVPAAAARRDARERSPPVAPADRPGRPPRRHAAHRSRHGRPPAVVGPRRLSRRRRVSTCATRTTRCSR